MRSKQRSNIGLQYNISPEIIRSAEARGLDAIATGGNCDYICRALNDKSNGPRMILCAADDAGSPDTLTEKANVTLYLDDEDWSDGGYISFNFDTAVDALDFMAGFNDAIVQDKSPLSCRSCGRELGSTPHCEECQTYGNLDTSFVGMPDKPTLVEIAKKVLGIHDTDQPNGIVPEPSQGWDKIEGGQDASE